MDEESAGARVRKLRGEITQLTARADELTDAMGSEPTAPPPSTIERLQAYLADAITNGTANERKAAIEALIAEIRITEEGVIPVFRIPGPRTPVPGGDDTATITETEPVRAMVRSVALSELKLNSRLVTYLRRCEAGSAEAEIRAEVASPLGRRYQPWAIERRLSKADVQTIIAEFLSGTPKHELARRYSVSLSGLKSLLRRRGVRRRPQPGDTS